MSKTYERTRNADGEYVGIKDPPIIREFEQRLEDAKSACDKDMIALISEEYEAERERIANALDPQDDPDTPDVELYDHESADVEDTDDDNEDDAKVNGDDQ